MADDDTPVAGAPVDPGALIRSRRYRVILVFAAIIGLVVSLAAWAFLELVHGIQVGVYQELPGTLGFDSVPWWWPLPWRRSPGCSPRSRSRDFRAAADTYRRTV